MPIAHLPPELLDAVCDHLPPNDLAAFSRTSSSISSIAQRSLYRHIAISSISNNLSVVVTLAKRPHLAKYVRTFAMNIGSSNVFHSFYQQLATAIANMSEIFALELSIDPKASWILNNTTNGSAYPRLQHFACTFPLDSHVTQFLSKADDLLELEVQDEELTSNPTPVTSTLPPSAIPRLSKFVGSSRVAMDIVPGRPVSNITLLSGDLTQFCVATLATASAPVEILSVTTSSVPLTLLETITECMPHLMHLRIMTSFSFPAAPEVSFYDDIAKALGSLRKLQGFELSGMHWCSTHKATDSEGRIWQSRPSTPAIAARDLDADDVDIDFFLAY